MQKLKMVCYHPHEAEAFGRAGNAIAAEVTWDRAIGRLLA